MKIAVVGIGYVGLSLAILLSQKNEVVAYDINKDKVDKINSRISPINDNYIIKYLNKKRLKLTATDDYSEAFRNADYIIICTPTNYNETYNSFDTSSIEDTIYKIKKINKHSIIVIRSTVPIGYTESLNRKEKKLKITFSPEFLREGYALYDNLYPTRIIVGDDSNEARIFANLLYKAALKKDIPILYMNSVEAESVKLFANTYLALRIAYFNELDTYANQKKLNVKNIINGVCLDPRIGNYYNNPSFGYGGYCLPKDSKQLLQNYGNIPEKIIKAVVESNITRKKYIVSVIKKKKPKIVGIYRLIMKQNSDNFRDSSIQDIIKYLVNNNIKTIIYEPSLKTKKFLNCEVVNIFNDFVETSEIIVANRLDNKIMKFENKVFSRDIYNRD